MTRCDTETASMEGDLLAGLRRLSCQDIDQAPESVGLYAWYAVLNVGPKDWQIELDGDKDLGIDRMCRLLLRQTHRVSPPPLEVDATATFSRWKGCLDDASERALINALQLTPIGQADQDYDKKRSGALQDTVESPAGRHALVRVLERSSPFLSAPLYVGVAEDLRARLAKHAQDLYKFSDVVSRDPDARDRLLAATKTNFALRAVAKGFSVDDLEVWALDLRVLLGPDISTPDLRRFAEAAEWLINRWSRPSLGKK